MELFIRIKDGQPFEHPILGNNFRQAFPDVDTDNLPESFVRFMRVEPPQPGEYQKLELHYGWADGVVKDVWSFVEMTDEERAEVDRIKAEALASQLLAAQQVLKETESAIAVTRV